MRRRSGPAESQSGTSGCEATTTTVQWIIRLADARVDYSVLALVRRTFRAERVRGTGLSFSIRNKLDAAKTKDVDLSALPPISGFADPPLRTPEVQGAKAAGNPWRIEVRNIRIEHFDDIWFDACHYRGTAHLDGAFFLRPGLLVWIGPARVSIETWRVANRTGRRRPLPIREYRRHVRAVRASKSARQ